MPVPTATPVLATRSLVDDVAPTVDPATAASDGFHAVARTEMRTGPSCRPGYLADAGGRCYQLSDGPAVLAGLVASARADDKDGLVTVTLTLTPSGLDHLNVLTEGCYNLAAWCNTTDLALVVDGVVVFARSTISPHVDGPDVVMSGPFDRASARAVVRAFTH